MKASDIADAVWDEMIVPAVPTPVELVVGSFNWTPWIVGLLIFAYLAVGSFVAGRMWQQHGEATPLVTTFVAWPFVWLFTKGFEYESSNDNG